MSETTTPEPSTNLDDSNYRVLSVRTNSTSRTQLEVLANLNGRSVTEEARVAIDGHIERSKSDPTIQKRAADVRAQIERDAESKRNAIEAIFGDTETNARTKATKP